MPEEEGGVYLLDNSKAIAAGLTFRPLEETLGAILRADMARVLEADTRSNVETAMADLKQVMYGDDVEVIKTKSEALTQASHKLAEAMYQQTAQDGQGDPGAEAGAQDTAGAAPNADDDVVDADFEEVKEEEKK